jgi:uncharacterized YigZ family protein
MIHTIQKPVSATIKILRSEFIAFLYPVNSTEALQDILRQHQTDYANATHNCYAYVLGYKQETEYYSDAGEPGGTAGKPILNSLLRNNLSGVLAIVTRYYGGNKLGVKGLIDAYTEATQAAIDQAELVPYILYRDVTISTDYGFLESLRHQLRDYQIIETEAIYTDKVSLSLKVPEQRYYELRDFLVGFKAMGRLDFTMEDQS